ncbi:MAG: LacI family DNA-binding transcriptional regulator [Cellulomonadaceae bacterium]
MTITDVARAAQVSTATVSRVLNRVSTVDPVLAERVQAAIARTGYVPNGAGRALRRQRSDTWAAIVPDVQNPFFTAVVAAVEEIASESGYSVVLCNTDERIDQERRYIQTAIGHRMSGVVIAAASARFSDLTPLEDAGIPIVLVDRAAVHTTGDSVLVDNTRAGELAADHLLDLGHRRFACIAGPADVSTAQDRLTGFRRALAARGVAAADVQVRRGDLRLEGGLSSMRALLEEGPAPDAVFTTNGLSTAGAYRAIQAHGSRMPQDVALVGVDDEFWTRMVTPAISVVRQPVTEIGRTAAQLLAARTSSEESVRTRPAQDVVLEPELLPRASTVGA